MKDKTKWIIFSENNLIVEYRRIKVFLIIFNIAGCNSTPTPCKKYFQLENKILKSHPAISSDFSFGQFGIPTVIYRVLLLRRKLSQLASFLLMNIWMFFFLFMQALVISFRNDLPLILSKLSFADVELTQIMEVWM